MPKKREQPFKDIENETESISVQLEHVCLQYPYKQLEASTKGFHESCRLGAGSAGTVFRAELPDGSYAAVKVIDLSTLGDNLLVAGFEDEIMILSKFRHPNLVVLMGWAKEGSRRFLLYEFLSGGDVTGRLQKSKSGRMPFLWHERLSVARDAATGLAHLHNATPRAFHRDIKSSNILLGPSGAKMADFGLSVTSKTRTGAAVDCEFPSGTPGYACPIYMRTGKVTEGSEVHSFGMLLLEMLVNMVPAGMIGGDVKYPIQDTIMPLMPGAVERAVAHADPTAGWPPPVAIEVATLALICIDGDEARRPCFNDICRQLRHIQDRFPPTCVLGPQVTLPWLPPMPGPPPGIANGCSHMAFGVPQAEPGLVLVAGPGPQGPGPPPPPGQLWPPPGPGAVGPPFAGQMPPPGSVILPPGAALGPAPYIPVPAGMVELQPQVVGWPMTAMGPVVGPAIGLPQQQTLPVGHPALSPLPLAEAALEITYVHLAQLAMMKPEFRMLPLVPSIDGEGRRCVKVGRAHQPQWFEAVLVDANDLNCISREACEFTWGGPGPAQAGLALRVLGTGVVIVDDEFVNRGGTAHLRPGSRITFAMQLGGGDLRYIISLAVHCAAGAAMPANYCPGRGAAGGPPAGAAAAHGLDRRSVLVHVENVGDKATPAQLWPQLELPCSGQEGAWCLECVFAAGLAPEAFWTLPATMRHFPLMLAPGASAVLVGRQHQPEMFEALLGRDPALLARVSRSHFALEPGEGRAKVTNMSQNIAVVAQRPLHQGESLEVDDGDTLSFAHTLSEEGMGYHSRPDVAATTQDSANRVSIVPFLTLRLVGPPPPTPASPFEMLSSLPIVAAPSAEAAEPPGAPPAGAATPRAAVAEEHHAVPATAPSVHRRAGPEATIIEGAGLAGASTAPVARPGMGSSLLCNAQIASSSKGGDCATM